MTSHITMQALELKAQIAPNPIRTNKTLNTGFIVFEHKTKASIMLTVLALRKGCPNNEKLRKSSERYILAFIA